MSEEDKELELLKAKRLREMQKNITEQQKQEELKAQKPSPSNSPSTREILVKQLGHRGLEILQNAESQFPNETKMVVDKLAELIQSGEITEVLDGGKLLALFRSIGIRVRVETTIHVEEDGKLVSWSDKLKERTMEPKESTSQETSEQNTL
ncbi:MAG: double-stranded DNA-binding protein [Thaumarchaeota archaeon]|nr:double-stranded DNA-binding protein [Nitrososphaerota archaeon]MBI3641758.1 double-stranded DNA-binding protein [Nitrososphaerota archaeon]